VVWQDRPQGRLISVRSKNQVQRFVGDPVAWEIRDTQLNIEERTMIQTELGMGLKPAAIARSLDRTAAKPPLLKDPVHTHTRISAGESRLWVL